MEILAGLFLVGHGLVHIPVWVTRPPPDAPFDSRHSWLLGDLSSFSRALAVLCCVVFVPAGILVLASASLGATLAIIGAAVSLLLVFLTLQPWFVFAGAINVAIIIVAVG
jgi:hypothetical protein